MLLFLRVIRHRAERIPFFFAVAAAILPDLMGGYAARRRADRPPSVLFAVSSGAVFPGSSNASNRS
jgi:hypothetical protein